MNDNQQNMTKLQEVRQNENGIVTYIYENGSKKQQPITAEAFKNKSTGDVLKMLNDTMHDYGAVSLEIN